MPYRRGFIGWMAMLAVLMGLFSPQAYGQDGPRIGIALSGGGVRGFAQIGVLQVLEEEQIDVDVVTGTSIGAVVGGLYAIGYLADTLAHLALSQSWDDFIAISSPRRRRPAIRRVLDDLFILRLAIRDGRPALPSSLVSGHRIAMVLTRLTLPYHGVEDFSRLPRSFAAIATDLETGEAVRLTRGHLAEAIQASLSIPSALATVEIDGRTLIDGGIARNLPAEDARALGADVVICINTTRDLQSPDSLHSMVEVLNQAVSFRIAENVKAQREHCDLIVEPKLDNRETFDFSSAEEVIKLGYEAGDSLRNRIRALRGIASISSAPDLVRSEPSILGPTIEKNYAITDIEVRGVETRLQRHVEDVLRFSLPDEVTPSDIETAVDRVYSSGPFRQVLYRLVPNENGHTLRLDVTRQDEGQFGASLRFESRYKASILLSAVGLNRVGYGPTLRASARLGQISNAYFTYIHPILYRHPLGIRLTGGADRYPIDVFAGSKREAELLLTSVAASGALSAVLAQRLAIGAGVRAEFFDLDHRIGGAEDPVSGQSVIGPEAMLLMDNLDRDVFPRRGHRVDVHAMAAADPFESTSFTRAFADWESRWALSESVSLIGRASVGLSRGEVPLHHRFYLGGPFEQPAIERRLVPLFGTSTDELSGKYMQAVAAGVQFQLNEDWYLTGKWNAGWAGSSWQWPAEDMRQGFGLSIGRQVLYVPAVVTVGARSLEGPYEVWINLGYEF